MKPVTRVAPITSAALLMLLTASGSFAGDWPQFRGPNRDGIVPDSPALIDKLPAKGIQAVWQREVGAGFAGPIVADGAVILFHRIDDTAEVAAFDASTGEPRWRFGYATDYTDDFGFDDGPRSAPTAAGGRVTVFGPEGMVHCLSAEDGKLLWKRDAASEFESPKGFFGRACAPLAVKNLIVLITGGSIDRKPAGIAAFDAESGATAWSAVSDEASYSSPVALSTPDGTLILALTRSAFVGIDAKDGALQFSNPFQPDANASVTAAAPVICGAQRVFISGCYGLGAQVWDLSGTVRTPQLVWKADDVLDCHYATPVALDGFLFGFHGRQESGQQLRCLSGASGEVQWSIPGAAGSLSAADGKLVIVTEDGELKIFQAAPDKPAELVRAQILGRGVRSPPAIADGFLYARDSRRLVCIDLRREGTTEK